MRRQTLVIAQPQHDTLDDHGRTRLAPLEVDYRRSIAVDTAPHDHGPPGYHDPEHPDQPDRESQPEVSRIYKSPIFAAEDDRITP